VSVLITDLVGSTAMAERVGPEATERLRSEHFGLLRGALEDTAGREVKNLGDGLMAVFDSATQSLVCAIAMQQALEARNRHAEEQLAVRIGVSLGDAAVDEGDYFGEPVVLSTRLCNQAQGGQIVVNALVRHIAGRREGLSFRPLGGLELKGVAEPVEAFELDWEPLAAVAIALPERLRELASSAYVGRLAERARLSELLAEASSGSRRLALISGEAGVGKTRLATHLALEAHEQGATVLYGRCDEDLGVPYQPWAQALRHLVAELPRAILDEHVERYGGDLARLIPALDDRLAELPAPRQSDPETERYLLYAAAAGILEQAAGQRPLVLILDDLHWADSPTLSLLRHVVSTAGGRHLLVLGLYRDSDLSRDHPLTALLADLHREHGVERLKLTGLQSEDVLALMQASGGYELDEVGRALAREITRETAGNPFFAGELLRHLAESGSIVQESGGRWHLVGDVADLGLPQSVREVVGRRVQRLGADARTALCAAAVIGRDFDLDLLLAVVDLPEAHLLDLLDEAVAASLLQENRDRVGRFTFTHALVEHTLYEELGTTRCARLHRLIAEALEEQCGDEPGERLGELAGHWAAATVSANTAKAIHYAGRAAERALSQLAPDEAARWYRQALELHSLAAKGDRGERCDLLIGLGEAQRQIGGPEYRRTLLDAAALARELGRTDQLARAVLANNRGYFSQTLAVDTERVRALEAAAEALPQDDPRRARVLALLASELHHAGEPERCRALSAQAIEMARAAGDPAVLAHTIIYSVQAILAPDTVQQRKLLIDELIELARRLDDPRLSFWAAGSSAFVGVESGDRARIEADLATVRQVAAAVPEPSMTWAPLIYESHFAILQGELGAAEQWAIKAFEAGTASGQPDAVVFFGVTVFQIRYFQGRTAELVEQSVRLAEKSDSDSIYRAGATLTLIESGGAERARELVLAEDFQSVPWDWNWSWTVFLWADVCCRLRLVERAGELYELLAPFSGNVAAAGGLISGSIDWAAGALAATLGRDQQAEQHFTAAAEIDQRLGAPLLLARTRARWARTLVARGRPEELERADIMLEQADETAARLGAQGLAQEVIDSRAALAAISR
jgi:class 3 adenylate cyclase